MGQQKEQQPLLSYSTAAGAEFCSGVGNQGARVVVETREDVPVGTWGNIYFSLLTFLTCQTSQQCTVGGPSHYTLSASLVHNVLGQISLLSMLCIVNATAVGTA